MIQVIRPITTIIDRVLIAPIRWVSDKIRKIAEAVFGYLLRIITFQLGEMKVRGAYIIMRIYQRLSSDPREEKPFDRNRLEESKKLLVQFGGVPDVVHPVDGGAEIHCTTFRSEAFFNEFKRLGSHPIDIIYEGRLRKALLNPPIQADKFYFPSINLRLNTGALVKAALLPEAVPPNQPRPMMLIAHSPGRSQDMDRRDIAKFLAAGCDVCTFDMRGTVDSTGSPSEGGYYNDADAVIQKLLREGTAPNQIFISGFCEGGAIGAYLKKKYHHLGVHFIGSNLFTSLKDVIEGHGILGYLGSRFGLQALQDPKLSVQQDFFNNVEKFRNLPRSEGKFILIHTDTDQLMPRGTVQKLCEAIDNSGPVHEILRIHPNPKANGHAEPPYQDPVVWRRLARLLVTAP
jgi:dienelactone hydrolase